MSPDEILAAFQRNVRRLDNWRGYIGDDEDSPTDDEVHEVLQRARLEIAGPRGGARIAEQLYLRVAELERQRDAVLALCDEARVGLAQSCSCRGLNHGTEHDYPDCPGGRDVAWTLKPGDVRAIYGKPVLLDVSRDPQQHPRDETGRYISEGAES